MRPLYASAGRQCAPAYVAVLGHQRGGTQRDHLVVVWRDPGFPSQGTPVHRCPAYHGEEAPTMFVSCVNFCSKVQEALQAGQALRLLTGQVQGAALVDLSQKSTARLAWGSGRLLVPCPPRPSE